MRKVAVFGNAGGGKSTLAKILAARMQLPLYALDTICFYPDGGAVPEDVYLKRHAELLAQSEWLIDGYGNPASLWARLSEADTLIYVDLPLPVHFWWVTKRLIKSLWVAPEGWPDNSPMLHGTLNAYRVIWLCHKALTPKYRAYVLVATASKKVFHLRSRSEIKRFLEGLSA